MLVEKPCVCNERRPGTTRLRIVLRGTRDTHTPHTLQTSQPAVACITKLLDGSWTVKTERRCFQVGFLIMDGRSDRFERRHCGAAGT